eukprot:COSAG04_NODE_21797_length_367_cov_0.783582_1_plen_63_part_01
MFPMLEIRQADNVVEERLRTLQGVHFEVEECLRLAEAHMRNNYDRHRREWKDQKLLRPGCKVW